MLKSEVIERAVALFDEQYACSQSILLAFAQEFNLEERTAKLISSTFGGGMSRLREKCGVLTGSFMVLGLKYGNTDPKDMDTKLAAYAKVRELNRQFEAMHGTTICQKLLDQCTTEDEVLRREHHRILCRHLVADAAGMLYDMVNPLPEGVS